MAEDQTVEDGAIPEPDLPSVPSVDGTSGTSYISLQNQNTNTSITIRRPYIQRMSRNIIMVAPRADDDNEISLHSEHMQNVHGATGTNYILMHEIQDNMQIYHIPETRLEAYISRLRTFRDWHVPFLDPEVLAEANFSYTGMGDTVRCNECGGELSNWQPGNDPRREHLNAFGFSCD
ncbi:putative inhibitor of apoptosis [Mercenaria mercenaria]|uniref:putative inhibitor of apoptosis n=1 Tax=Mercenaria mercenaria TaxID=6596 RepID=UPI00234FAA63|nr:putative inhibitor of apoptosis [Mercenaria mercenaria]